MNAMDGQTRTAVNGRIVKEKQTNRLQGMDGQLIGRRTDQYLPVSVGLKLTGDGRTRERDKAFISFDAVDVDKKKEIGDLFQARDKFNLR